MATKCPRCSLHLDNPSSIVCPGCGYTLRMPLIGKLSVALLISGLVVLISTAFLGEDLWFPSLLAATLLLASGIVAFVLMGLVLRKLKRGRPR